MMETGPRQNEVFLRCRFSLLRTIPLLAMSAMTLFCVTIYSLLLQSPPTDLGLTSWQHSGLTIVIGILFTIVFYREIRRFLVMPVCHGQIDSTGITAFESHYPWEEITSISATWIPGCGYQLSFWRRRSWIVSDERYIPTAWLTPMDLDELADHLNSFLPLYSPHVRIDFPTT
jgi:hypothetical protein